MTSDQSDHLVKAVAQTVGMDEERAQLVVQKWMETTHTILSSLGYEYVITLEKGPLKLFVVKEGVFRADDIEEVMRGRENTGKIPNG